MLRCILIGILFCLVATAPVSVRGDDGAVAVLPFSLPGAPPNDQDVAATTALLKALAGAGMTAVPLEPLDHLTAVATAADICAKKNVQRVLVPFLTTGQEQRSIVVMFVPIVHWPKHAEVRLAELNCTGALTWSTVQTAAKDFIGTNVGSAVSAVTETAVGQSVAALATHAAPAPASSPRISQQRNPPKTATVAVIPFAQPGAFDPLLNEATVALIAALGKQHIVAIQTTTLIDHLTVPLNAADICARYNVQEIEVGTIQTHQSVHGGFIGSDAAALVDSVNCSGTVTWSLTTVGNSNGDHDFDASKAAAVYDAFGTWAKAKSAAMTAPAALPSPLAAPTAAGS